MFDTSLKSAGRTREIFHQQGRLGSLGSDTLGAEEIEMPEECARPGEILLGPGVCGPDPRRPIDPYASAPTVVKVPISSTKARAAAATKMATAAGMGGMSKATLAVAAVAAVGLIYFIGKQK
jgi:hypothetical protein